MGKNKKKEPTAADARRVLSTICKFNDSSQGEADRGHFRTIVVTALDSHLSDRIEMSALGIPLTSIKGAYNGESIPVDASTRVAIIGLLTERATKLISSSEESPQGPAATQG